ncbi:hypothetical protein HYX12_03660 [Candidatus Woesearchaeota archaeon]|nr:hypothetical protein [Candidatus Woesearchaeota archaeon]
MDSTDLYLWGHIQFEELDTPKFNELSSSNAVIFREGVAYGGFEYMRLIEATVNEYAATANEPKEWNWLLQNSSPLHRREFIFLVEILKRNKSRLVMERTLPPSRFDYVQVEQTGIQAFFDYESPADAAKVQEQCLALTQGYEQQRERGICRQLLAIDNSAVLTVIGFGHRSIADDIRREGKKVEAHFPYEGYLELFQMKMQEDFRLTGKVDPEIYARAVVELYLRQLIINQPENSAIKQQNNALRYYTNTITNGQIAKLRRNMLETKVRDAASFSRFAEDEGLKSLEDALKS